VATTLDKLGKNLNVLVARMGENIDKLVKKTAFNVMREVVHDTPVDTGKAVSNWRAGAGFRPSGEREAHVPGIAQSTREENIEATLRAGFSKIIKRKPKQTIFITNDASYINELNAGTSTKAPAGFIEQGIQAGIRTVKGTRVLGRFAVKVK